VTRRPATRELSQLNEVLWGERRLLDVLLYRLVSAKLVLAADEKRFIPLALAEVERTMERIRVAELQRSLVIGRLSLAWDVPRDELTLVYLADWAPEPARTLFEDHRNACLELTAEIESVSRENQRLASAGLSEVRELVELVVGSDVMAAVDGGAYTQRGAHERPSEIAYRVDEVL
jgi:hypothetical protein